MAKVSWSSRGQGSRNGRMQSSQKGREEGRGKRMGGVEAHSVVVNAGELPNV